jgi:outer membrane protein OmpA-like peptidoglycan-associated protein
MDSVAAQLRAGLQNVEIRRVAEGVRLTYQVGALFDRASSDLRPGAEGRLRALAVALLKNVRTNVLVEAHTDSVGSDQYNLDLSIARAAAIQRYLQSQGVRRARIVAVGYGEIQALADNGTAEGRLRNNRLEVSIFANDDLRRAALDAPPDWAAKRL